MTICKCGHFDKHHKISMFDPSVVWCEGSGFTGSGIVCDCKDFEAVSAGLENMSLAGFA